MEADVWRLVAKPSYEEPFEALYAPEGSRAAFFRGCNAYRGTFLLRSRDAERGYVLIDVWSSRSEQEEFCRVHADRYRSFDDAGAGVTESRSHEGWFSSVEDVMARI